jgi:hypothetical protein
MVRGGKSGTKPIKQGGRVFPMRRSVYAGISIGVLLALLCVEAAAQPTPAQRGVMGPGRMLCDVEGLWAYATFEAKLDTVSLEKVRPICQTAYDARATVAADTNVATAEERLEKIVGLGDTMVGEVQQALGEQGAKLEPWITRRSQLLARVKANIQQRREAAPPSAEQPSPPTPSDGGEITPPPSAPAEAPAVPSQEKAGK